MTMDRYRLLSSGISLVPTEKGLFNDRGWPLVIRNRHSLVESDSNSLVVSDGHSLEMSNGHPSVDREAHLRF